METDCGNLVQLVQAKKRERTRAQMIVDDIQSLASSFDFCVFKFAKRNCNKVAHSISQSSISLSEVRVWMEDHPSDVLPLVISDKAFLYH